MCPEAAVQGSWDPPVGVVAKQVTRRVTMGKARTKAGHSKNVDGDGRRRLGRQRPPSLSAGERQRRPGEGQLDHVRGDGDGFAETLLSHTAANRTPSRCSSKRGLSRLTKHILFTCTTLYRVSSFVVLPT
ncbi:hypothetical protein GW17_00008467 [Ensete ventricosum]|nr:hypothetical protein GW17_00008467 [Ensete ventricosum]